MPEHAIRLDRRAQGLSPATSPVHEPQPRHRPRQRVRPAGTQRRGQDHHAAHGHGHPARPTRGTIEILGRPADRAARDRIGYMPEERGLYPRMVLEEQLLFLAELKGVPRSDAAQRLAAWLERLGLARLARSSGCNELSKGMQQKAQFIATRAARARTC